MAAAARREENEGRADGATALIVRVGGVGLEVEKSKI
jgi:hypothetical protein